MIGTPIHTMLHSLRRAGLTDAELLERFIAARDEAAFEVLVWRHSALVFGLCRRVLRQEQDAEDAFQATFLTLARRAGTIRNGQTLSSWLYKVAHRIAWALRRQAAIRGAREGIASAESLEQEPAASDDPELRALVDEEIQRLPEKYRAAVLLCYFEGKTNEAAAAEIGCPKGTVVSRLARARERLRRRLSLRGVEAPALLLEGGTWSTAVPRALLTKTCQAVSAKACGNGTAGLVSTRVLHLAQGAIRTMLWTKVKLVVAGLGVAMLSLGSLGLAASAVYRAGESADQGPALVAAPAVELPLVKAQDADDNRNNPRRAPKQLRQVNDNPDEANPRVRSANNLKQILLAMHNYHDAHKRFPAPAVYSRDGKALLSWRVELLPFLGQNELYEKFHHNEPWDGPHNRLLLDQMPGVFALPGVKKDDATYYQVFVGPGAAFEKRKGRKISEFTDGTSNTIMVVEAASPVPWTKPEDLVYDPDQPLPELGGTFTRNFHVAFADGSVHAVPNDFSKADFRKLITCNGGEVVDVGRAFGRQQPPGPNGGGILESLRDEVLSLKAEVRRLQDRVQRLETAR